MDSLKGKNCFISGATGALGWELAKQLHHQGCNLFLTSRSTKKLESLKNDLDAQSSGQVVAYQAADLSSLSQTSDLISAVDKTFGVDILINCAGVFMIKEIDRVTPAEINGHMNVNVISPYMFCQAFCKNMKNNRWGRIINIGSSSSYAGFNKGSLYCATKHAILGLSRSLLFELREYGVKVSCFSPGSMQSEMAKISTNQDFSTFLIPSDVAECIVAILAAGGNLVCDEMRLNRMVIR
jgi:short-subunit dehydrogenase